MFRFYFLALLLIFALPVFGQEADASEETPAQSDAVAPAQEAPAETVQQEEAPAAEQPAEANSEKDAAPAKEEAPAKEGSDEEQSDLEKELAAQAENPDAATDKADESKKAPKFTVGLNNGLSHGFAKERKSFGYTLNAFFAYNMPLDFSLSASIGLRESYRYGMSVAYSNEDGSMSKSDLDYSKFDGIPFNIGLSKGFAAFAGILGSIGLDLSIPFTSVELWDQYKIRSILGVNFGLAKNWSVAQDTTLGLSFGFNYAKTFAAEDYAWDQYTNEPMGANQEHNIDLSLALGVNYKGFGFKVSGGYNFGKDYQMNSKKYYYDGFYGSIDDTNWYYLFSFGATASYSVKGFVFALGVRTNAPEFDNGNYEGFKELPGDPDVKNGSTNYPFKAKYTTVFANIGYSYSF